MGWGSERTEKNENVGQQSAMMKEKRRKEKNVRKYIFFQALVLSSP
jgi:hypothetical protein